MAVWSGVRPTWAWHHRWLKWMPSAMRNVSPVTSLLKRSAPDVPLAMVSLSIEPSLDHVPALILAPCHTVFSTSEKRRLAVVSKILTENVVFILSL